MASNPQDKGGSQHDKDSSPNLSFNGLNQREMEKEEGSAIVSWYEAQLLIGQPNGVVQNFKGVVKNLFFLKLILYFIVHSAGSSGSRMRDLVMSPFF